MKKFLTVLLVIAVMFTFSFSGAFASTFTDSDNYNQSVVDGWFSTLWSQYLTAATYCNFAAAGGQNYTVKTTTLAGLEEQAKAAYNEYIAVSATNYVTSLTNFTNALTIKNAAKNIDFALAAVKAQYAADKAAALAKYDGINVLAYSTEESDMTIDGEAVTYKAAAEALIAEAKEAINDTDDFTTDATIKSYVDAKAAIDAVVEGTATSTNVSATDALSLGVCEVFYYDKNGITPFTTGTYQLMAAFNNSTGVLNWGVEAVAAQSGKDAAAAAALKAQIASEYANQLVGADAAKKKTLAAWKELMDLGVDLEVTGVNASYTSITTPTELVEASEALAEIDAMAAKYLTEKDATGATIYDPAVIAKKVKDAKKKVVAAAIASTVDKVALVSAFEGTLTAANTSLEDASLTWDKEHAKAVAKSQLDGFVEGEVYYPAELAKVQAAYDEYIAKVDAVTDATKLPALKTAYDKKIRDINKASVLNDAWASSNVEGLYTSLDAYVNYYNASVSTTSEDEDLDGSKLLSNLCAYVGNNGARTSAEIKALANDAMTVAQTLPTYGQVKEALKAAKAAAKAIPATVKVENADTVKAALDAIKAYKKLTTRNYAQLPDVSTAQQQLANAYAQEFSSKVYGVDKKDAAAVKALISEINAVVDAGVATPTTVLTNWRGAASTCADGTLYGALNDLKKADLKALTTKVAAIPVTVTPADEAVVKAARAAYDEYVAKYTVYGYDKDDEVCFYDGYAANDGGVYATIVTAEATLGLNNPEYKDVEALKLTAKSVAKKGYIKVSWTVKGDAAAADGYQVYRSTKANKGFKKAFTTAKKTYKNTKVTKGTRYYYKVRAYKTVDGVKYYSDWSNKAYRVAK